MLHELIRQYGYWMVFAGTVLQGDATVIAASFLAHRGFLDLRLIALTSVVATTLESACYYEIARWKRTRSPDFLNSPSSARISEVLNWLDRRGSTVLLVSRFLPGFRMPIALACGASKMPRTRFLYLNLAGAAVWVAAMEGVGYSGGNLFDHLASDVKQHEWAVAAILALAVILLVAVRTRGRVFQDVVGLLRKPAAGIARSIDRLAKAFNTSNGVWAFFRCRRRNS